MSVDTVTIHAQDDAYGNLVCAADVMDVVNASGGGRTKAKKTTDAAPKQPTDFIRKADLAQKAEQVRLGYACINITLQQFGITAGRTIQLASIRSRGMEALREAAVANICDMIRVLWWNEHNGIRFMRLTMLIPQMTNPAITEGRPYIDITFARPYLRRLGALARDLGHRLTFHPGQFVQLGSPREDVVSAAIADLDAHARLFVEMGLRPEDGSVYIIHGGGVYDTGKGAHSEAEARRETLARFTRVCAGLSPITRAYMSIENDELWDIQELLPVSEQLGIPLTIDFFHHTINGEGKFPLNAALYDRVIAVWRRRGIKPKIHWSQQEPGKRRGAHSTVVDHIAPHVLDFCRTYGADIMIEAKAKEANALKLLPKYFDKTYADDNTDSASAGQTKIVWRLRDDGTSRN